MVDLLKDALTDMENLQEYYKCQRKSVIEYVNENIEKYKYGIALDRYFMKEFAGDEVIELSEHEMDLVNAILEEFDTEEREDGTLVIYKLKDIAEKDRYELNPQIARTEFLKLIQQPNILYESILMMLLVKFEEAISGMYRFLLEKFPQAYLSNKSITYSELVSFDSNIEDIREVFIKKEIDEFMRQPISDWYDSFEKKHGGILFCDENEFEEFKEVYYRRNLIVHNQGLVNENYLNNVKESTMNPGERATVDDQYITEAFLLTKKMLIGTLWGLRKVANDEQELLNYLFDYGYDCMLQKQWKLSKYIFGVLTKEEGENAADSLCEKINYWITIKNLNGIDVIREEVEALDVSAMKLQFAVAKYALLDEHDKVSACLEDAINDEIPVWCIREWPLLLQYRETKQYKDFVRKHVELFEKQGYESNNEVIGTSDDIMVELGDSIKIALDS